MNNEIKEKLEKLEELEFELFIAKQLKDKIKIKNAKRKITLLENKIEKEKKNGKTNEII